VAAKAELEGQYPLYVYKCVSSVVCKHAPNPGLYLKVEDHTVKDTAVT
jgi:hypothetical protein